MKPVVVDTHCMVWYFTGDPRLSEVARHVLEQAEDGDVQALVPTVVLAEAAHIAQRKKAPVSIQEVVELLRQENGFVVVPFDFEIFSAMLKLPMEWELHDRIIARISAQALPPPHWPRRRNWRRRPFPGKNFL